MQLGNLQVSMTFFSLLSSPKQKTVNFLYHSLCLCVWCVWCVMCVCVCVWCVCVWCVMCVVSVCVMCVCDVCLCVCVCVVCVVCVCHVCGVCVWYVRSSTQPKEKRYTTHLKCITEAWLVFFMLLRAFVTSQTRARTPQGSNFDRRISMSCRNKRVGAGHCLRNHVR